MSGRFLWILLQQTCRLWLNVSTVQVQVDWSFCTMNGAAVERRQPTGTNSVCHTTLPFWLPSKLLYWFLTNVSVEVCPWIPRLLVAFLCCYILYLSSVFGRPDSADVKVTQLLRKLPLSFIHPSIHHHPFIHPSILSFIEYSTQISLCGILKRESKVYIVFRDWLRGCKLIWG